MSVIKRASGIRCKVGGFMDSRGWAVAKQGAEVPEPVRVVTLTLAIEDDDGGFLLLCASEDKSVWSDSWLETLALAEQAAAEQFGVRPEQWVS